METDTVLHSGGAVQYIFAMSGSINRECLDPGVVSFDPLVPLVVVVGPGIDSLQMAMIINIFVLPGKINRECLDPGVISPSTFNPTTDGSSAGDYTFSLSTSAGVVTTTNAIGLDGVNDYMTTNLQLNNYTAFTMEGWVYPYVGGSRKGFFGQNDNIEFGFNGSTTIAAWSNSRTLHLMEF